MSPFSLFGVILRISAGIGHAFSGDGHAEALKVHPIKVDLALPPGEAGFDMFRKRQFAVSKKHHKTTEQFVIQYNRHKLSE